MSLHSMRLKLRRERGSGTGLSACFALLTGLTLVACGGGSAGDGGGTDTDTDTDDGGINLDSGDAGTAVPGESGGTFDDSGGGGDETSEPIICEQADFVLEAVPPNVMLVIDKSGSMVNVNNNWDSDNDPDTPEETRWASLYDVVESVVTSFEAEINFGANLFPSTEAQLVFGEGACPVSSEPEVPVQPMNAAAILAGIPGRNADGDEVIGATPATAGIEAARAHLKTLDSSVDRFMILITDGAANCGADADTSACPGLGCGLMEEYDANLPLVVGSAYTDDLIPTFVVGIDIQDELQGSGAQDGAPEANTFQELNTVAEAGGRARDGAAKFFNAANEIELQEALQEIAGQVVSCTVPLDPVPSHPDLVEIEIEGQKVKMVDDCSSEDGWVYVNPDGPYDAIRLCGTACDMLAEFGSLDALYECPPAG